LQWYCCRQMVLILAIQFDYKAGFPGHCLGCFTVYDSKHTRDNVSKEMIGRNSSNVKNSRKYEQGPDRIIDPEIKKNMAESDDRIFYPGNKVPGETAAYSTCPTIRPQNAVQACEMSLAPSP
jgi:hypothetical protein